MYIYTCIYIYIYTNILLVIVIVIVVIVVVLVMTPYNTTYVEGKPPRIFYMCHYAYSPKGGAVGGGAVDWGSII